MKRSCQVSWSDRPIRGLPVPHPTLQLAEALIGLTDIERVLDTSGLKAQVQVGRNSLDGGPVHELHLADNTMLGVLLTALDRQLGLGAHRIEQLMASASQGPSPQRG